MTLTGKQAAGLGWMVILAGLAVGYGLCGGAWRVGIDDGWELGKIQFAVQHPHLLQRVWNDQPWLHTLLNAALCRWLGEGPWLPRLFTVVSVAAMWGAVAWMGGPHLRFVGMLTAALLWAGSFNVLSMGFSVMLEAPAWAWGVVSAGLLYRATGTPSWRWVGLSGALMAAALHLKLTAALVAPGLALLCWRQYGWQGALRLLGPWCIGFCAVFVGVAWLSPSFRWEWLLGSHWAARAGARDDADFGAMWAPLLGTDHLPLLIGGALGLVAAARTGWPPVGVFALGVLGGAFLFKAVAYPWWLYYEYHFAVPLSVLGGLAMAWAVQALRGQWLRHQDPSQEDPPRAGLCHERSLPAWVAVWMVAALAAFGVGFGSSAPYALWAHVRVGGRQLDPVFLPHLQQAAGRVQWCYSTPHHFPELAHCRILPPPELLILPRKRFWSGQISWLEVTQYLDDYGVELLILQREVELAQPLFVAWLTNRYDFVTRHHSWELWQRKSGGEADGLPGAQPAPALQGGGDL